MQEFSHRQRQQLLQQYMHLSAETFIYREFNIKEMFATIGNACNTTGTTMVIIGCATAFTKILTIEKIPGAITNGIINFTDNKILILLLINVLLLIVGCFMDTTPAMMVLAPILLPIAAQFGVDPIHFGIVMVVNLAISSLHHLLESTYSLHRGLDRVIWKQYAPEL